MSYFCSRRKIVSQLASVASGVTGLIGLGSGNANAQLRIEVSGVGATLLSIVIAPFRGEEGAPLKISAVIQTDLVRSGAFRSIEPPYGITEEDNERNRSLIRSMKVDAVLVGSLTPTGNGSFNIYCRLWDGASASELGAQKLLVTPNDLRYAAHQISDWVYQKILGERGCAATRIAYVTRLLGGSASVRFNLWIADSDGENARAALTSHESIISPSWSPDGMSLAYVSFEARKPIVYVHELKTGRRRIVADFKGSNSSPSWSPDGRHLLVTLSKDGGSHLFLISAQGGQEARKLPGSSRIDTEGVFSPDGKSIYFVSDRGGNPQIYRMSMDDGVTERITYSSDYSISPAISPNGAKLAFISRSGRRSFRLCVQDLASGVMQAITDTQADERPSFSPNGKQIIYATQIARGGLMQEALMTTNLDGSVKSKLIAASGDVREPAWGPFQFVGLK